MYGYFLEPMYKFIGNNAKRMKENYDKYNKSTDNDKKSHVDYFRNLQHECSFLLYQALMEEARTSYIQASNHERSVERRDHRNGYKRSVNTRIPGSEHLVTFTPQVRNFPDKFTNKLLMKKLPNAFEEYIIDLITHGRSSNDIKTLIAKHMNISISKTKILSLLDRFEEERKKWLKRDLKNDYPFIFIDGTWVKVRKHGKIRQMVYITALGMREDGVKEVLGFRLAKSENEDDVYSLLKNIYMRGVKDAKLIVADGASAIKKSACGVWADAQFQLCTIHKRRSIIRNASNKRRIKNMLVDAKKILESPSFNDASNAISTFKKKWGEKEPKAVKCFLNNLELCFTYYDITDDPDMRKKLHSTNHIERLFKGAKKRIKELGYMRSPKKAKVWFYKIIKEESKKGKNILWSL